MAGYSKKDIPKALGFAYKYTEKTGSFYISGGRLGSLSLQNRTGKKRSLLQIKESGTRRHLPSHLTLRTLLTTNTAHEPYYSKDSHV